MARSWESGPYCAAARSGQHRVSGWMHGRRAPVTMFLDKNTTSQQTVELPTYSTSTARSVNTRRRALENRPYLPSSFSPRARDQTNANEKKKPERVRPIRRSVSTAVTRVSLVVFGSFRTRWVDNGNRYRIIITAISACDSILEIGAI